MAAETKLRLTRLEVEGFRGVNHRIGFDFAPRCTLLFAPNGGGKTSLLGAIEWCLFGRLQYQPAENLAHDEILNLHHPAQRASVRLTLERDGETFVVERSREARKRETPLRAVLEGGEVREGEAAAAALFRLLGLTFDDFYRAVYLHQESVRGLLIDEPRERDEALDRLFGLDRLRDVLGAIPMRVVREAIQTIEDKRSHAVAKLTGAAQVIEGERGRHEREAVNLGLDPKELTVETATRLVDELRTGLDRASSAAGAEPTELGEASSVEDLERVARGAGEATRALRLTVTAGAAGARRTALDSLMSRLKTARNELDAAEKRLRAHLSGEGDDDALAYRKSEVEANAAGAREALQLLDSEQRMLTDALAHAGRPDVRVCPVCEQSVDAPRLAARLRERVSSVLRDEHARLHDRMGDAARQLDELAEAQRQRNALKTTRGQLEERLGAAAREARTTLNLNGDEGERKVLAELERELDSAARRAADQERSLQEIDAAADRLAAVARVLRSEEDFASVRVKTAAAGPDESEALESEIDRLAALQDSLETISRAVTGVARSRAGEAIDGSRSAVSDHYRTLCGHPYFDGIRIDAQERNVAGVRRNSYYVRAFATSDGRETLASSRLSTAQMNGVALSIYLALGSVLSHHLGFVILDDPSQSLDTEHKAALVSILEKLTSRRQVVLATQDTELQTMLRRALARDGSAYELDWSRSGVKVSKSR